MVVVVIEFDVWLVLVLVAVCEVSVWVVGMVVVSISVTAVVSLVVVLEVSVESSAAIVGDDLTVVVVEMGEMTGACAALHFRNSPLLKAPTIAVSIVAVASQLPPSTTRIVPKHVIVCASPENSEIAALNADAMATHAPLSVSMNRSFAPRAAEQPMLKPRSGAQTSITRFTTAA